MTISLIWVHAAVLAAVMVAAYFMHMKTVRLRARFQLYRVRDKLVLLASSGTLKEDGRIFSLFYKRVNACLGDDQPLGMDDLIHSILKNRDGRTLDELLAHAKQRVRLIQIDPEATSPEVRAVISDFYNAMGTLLMAHSNVVRLLYKLSQFAFLSAFEDFLMEAAPKHVREGMATVNFVVSEANTFAGR